MKDLLNIFRLGSEQLRKKLVAHMIGIVMVAIIFTIVVVTVDSQREEKRTSDRGIRKYLSLVKVDFGDPVDRAAFSESLRIFYTGQGARNDSLLQTIDDLRQRQVTDPTYKTGSNLQGLTWDMAPTLGGMYVQFVAVYVFVLVLIYLVAQRIGVYRFVKMKQHRESYLQQVVHSFGELRGKKTRLLRWKGILAAARLLGKAIAKGFILVLLFSPAYVIAYSLKTAIDTSSLLFMMLLGVVSNGVLIHTANSFFTLLVSESHKGYVQTAVVKNLHSSYEWNTPDGIPLRSLLRTRRAFQSHVFSHIFLNARFQFIPALGEHASFLVTGLIIIEMALNIQGHLCYELLQQILYGQYDVACVIVFGIFLVVKITVIAVDIWHDRETQRYGY